MLTIALYRPNGDLFARRPFDPRNRRPSLIHRDMARYRLAPSGPGPWTPESGPMPPSVELLRAPGDYVELEDGARVIVEGSESGQSA